MSNIRPALDAARDRQEEPMPITKGHKLPDTPEPEFALLPCPFCGSTDLWIDWDDHAPNFWVNCNTDDCMDLGPFGANEAEAAERWNQRATDARLVAIAAAAAAYREACEAYTAAVWSREPEYVPTAEKEAVRLARERLFAALEATP